jgi:Mo-co oxidoreductase dimerisation domain
LANVGWWFDPDWIINELGINSTITSPAHEEVVTLDSQKEYVVRGYAYSSAPFAFGKIYSPSRQASLCMSSRPALAQSSLTALMTRPGNKSGLQVAACMPGTRAPGNCSVFNQRTAVSVQAAPRSCGVRCRWTTARRGAVPRSSALRRPTQPASTGPGCTTASACPWVSQAFWHGMRARCAPGFAVHMFAFPAFMLACPAVALAVG